MTKESDDIHVMMDPNPDDAPETIRMLVSSLPANVKVTGFRWKSAFRGRYDVLHLHWPELRASAPGRVRRSAYPTMFLALTLLNLMRRKPTVWTVHNVEPHERLSPLSRLALGTWERHVSVRVFMYESARFPDQRTSDLVIRRGDYLPYLEALAIDAAAVEPAGILNFGLIRPYKGIETLLDSYEALPESARPALFVCGSPEVPDYAEAIARRGAEIPGVVVELGHVPDRELVDRIRRARLIVLPYRKIYNSGTVLLALTLNRHVLVPDSPTMRELREEVGGDWVMLFSELTPEALQEALTQAQSAAATSTPPNLTLRDWKDVGESYAALYANPFENTTVTRDKLAS